MKTLPLLKLLLLIALAAWMHVMAVPAEAHPDLLADSVNGEAVRAAKTLSVPETSSVVLIGALGLTLMLRRRRLQA
jgi:hypothetical protein